MTILTILASTGWHDSSWNGPPWPGFFLFPLLLSAAVAITVLAVRRYRPAGAIRLVSERYARGEIDETEYRRRVGELRGRGR